MLILDVTETAKSDSKNIRLLANTFHWQLFNQWVRGFIPQIILNFETQHDQDLQNKFSFCPVYRKSVDWTHKCSKALESFLQPELSSSSDLQTECSFKALKQSLNFSYWIKLLAYKHAHNVLATMLVFVKLKSWRWCNYKADVLYINGWIKNSLLE